MLSCKSHNFMILSKLISLALLMLSSKLSPMFCGPVTYNILTGFSLLLLHLIPGKFHLQFQQYPNWWHTNVWLLPGYSLSALSKCLACLLDSTSTISCLQLKYSTEKGMLILPPLAWGQHAHPCTISCQLGYALHLCLQIWITEELKLLLRQSLSQ